jgi:pyruvate dehydrogenase E2 component (dihydrolipoamide acetyltransferase)
VPDFWAAIEVDMTAVSALREDLRGLVDPLPSVNDFLVKAAAAALRRHPRANGSFREEGFELHERINIGVAVAADDALVVPVLHDADRRPISELASEARRLAASVRDGTIAPADIEGATFTISNLGMMGVAAFAGIVDPPCAAILCVGAIMPRAIVHDSEVVAAPTVVLTLVSDHRILYGADAAAFLAELQTLLERPLASLV